MDAKTPIPAPPAFLSALGSRKPTLRNLAFSLCRNRDAAEKLLAHVLAKARRDHAAFDREGNFAAWLMSMMRIEHAAGAFLAMPPPAPGAAPGLAPDPAPDLAPAPRRGRPPAAVRAEIPEHEAYRPVDVAPFLTALQPPASADLGPRPELAWLPISLLRIDRRYQRDILRRGRANVIAIARDFDWREFIPAIVARIGDTPLFAMVDGQHRTTAAACRGIAEVPCMIIVADAARQARSFASINGNVTLMGALQLHAARVAAGDRASANLDRVCRSAGVEIMRYPVPASNLKAGQTLAVSCLAGALKTYGEDVLVAALLCITGTRDGNVGLVRASLIKGLCHALAKRPKLVADPDRAMALAEKVDLGRILHKAESEARRTHARVVDLLDARLAAVFDPARSAS